MTGTHSTRFTKDQPMPDLLSGAANLAQFLIPALIIAWADRPRRPRGHR